MIESRTAVDVEKAVRAWARAQGFTAFFGATGNLPEVVIQRVGGTDDEALVQFDCWATYKADAATLAADLATALTGLSSYDHDGIRLHDAVWLSSRWLPDPESDTPRYVVEATVYATSL